LAGETEHSGPSYASRLPKGLLRNCRVLSDRSEILALIPKGKVFCEIGVALGDFSEHVLASCAPSKYYAIDDFALHGVPQMWDGRVGRELRGKSHIEYYREKFREQVKSRIVDVMAGNINVMLEKLPARGVDIFFLNSDHSYSSVKKALQLIGAKAAVGAWIIVNDYTMADWLTNTRYGVIQASHEFMIEDGWEMTYLALHTAMFCVIVISKAAA
jgi:hypothetical protein